tara:strand:+ start:4215 stop:5555 length:1341 start_codon:yes stop_codon:yes gene_type:complete
MIYFDQDPKKTYKILKSKIPNIKIKNKNFMNKLHNLKISADFWWAVSGHYAILSEYLNMLSLKDPRFLNDLTKSKKEFPPGNIVRSTIIRNIARENLIDKNFKINNSNLEHNIDHLLFDEEEKHFSHETKKDIEREILPMSKLTYFLEILRLDKIKYISFKVKQKFIKFSCNLRDENEDKIFYRSDPDNDFEKILNLILPEYLNTYFPKWFLKLSDYLVKSKHKWITKFGYERNIYEILLMAKSYEKYGDKNIKIIAHGMILGIGFTNMYWFSLFPDLKLYNTNQTTLLTKTYNSNYSHDILFCPNSLPWIQDFFSITHFQEFMKVYRDAIKLINIGLKNGKKIRIRYKNFDYLSGYVGPHTAEECKIPIEKNRFEKVYDRYKLIVCMPFGTISEKCYQNNINCITYNYPYNLTNKQSYYKANSYSGVFKDADKFLNELEKKINEL